MVFPMNWKSTAFFSGAGLLATWLASVPAPTENTAPAVAIATPQPMSPAALAQASDIARLADRLEQRNQAGYIPERAERNPFRFVPRVTPRPARVPDAPTPVVLATEPPPPAILLSGVAMDRVNDADLWTAILSTPSGVVLAREGDEVGFGLKVSTIGADSVSLARPDGSVLTLPLSGK